MSDQFQIRLLHPEDLLVIDLACLVEEMQAYYDAPCPPRDEIMASLKGRPAGSEILIATDERSIAGFAAFSAIYPGPYLKPGLFLKDLFVGARWRGEGIGRTLMKAMARFAMERGLTRIDWTADRTDTKLLAFYDMLGGAQMREKVFYRLSEDALSSLAE